MPSHTSAVALFLLLAVSFAAARPIDNTNVGGGGGGLIDDGGTGTKPPITLPPVLRSKISGSITLVNCKTSAAKFYVKINGEIVYPSSGGLTSSRTYVLPYSKTYTLTDSSPGSYNIVPGPSAVALCPGGTWTPTSRTVNKLPASGQNFVFIRGRKITLDLIALLLTGALRGAELRLHNYQNDGSYVKLGSFVYNFKLSPSVVDLDCGRFCPDLGDGIFYVNDMRLESLKVTAAGNELQVALQFEDSGREIKGVHNTLGDDLMPDFNIDRKVSTDAGAVITAKARLVYTSTGAGISLQLYGAQLQSKISSTGACKIFGVDICNKIGGTNGRVKKSVEESVNKAFDSALLQAAISTAVTQKLSEMGYSSISSWAVYDGAVYVVTPSEAAVGGGGRINANADLVQAKAGP